MASPTLFPSMFMGFAVLTTVINSSIFAISSLLSECNPDDPLVPYIAEQYRKDKKKHDEIARRWTQIFAG